MKVKTDSERADVRLIMLNPLLTLFQEQREKVTTFFDFIDTIQLICLKKLEEKNDLICEL